MSQDHLDYFKDFANYQGVKMSYFENGGAKLAVVNADDESGRILLDRLEKKNASALSYGLYSPADCFAINVDEGIDGIRFVANICDDIVDVKSSLYGEFNVYQSFVCDNGVQGCSEWTRRRLRTPCGKSGR